MVSNKYWEYPNAGWWHLKERLAKQMSNAELDYARRDTFVTATEGMPCNYGKYMDENSVYVAEIRKRGRRTRAHEKT